MTPRPVALSPYDPEALEAFAWGVVCNGCDERRVVRSGDGICIDCWERLGFPKNTQTPCPFEDWKPDMNAPTYTCENVTDWFAYHKPSDQQVAVMQDWRESMSGLALSFVENSPSGPDQTAALRKLKEALTAMNAALVSPSPSPRRADARNG